MVVIQNLITANS
ncbi:hypothetical protein FWK35_00031110 [Aphis craccivora]|uniref:Uncharacterized protein n=1 Tax=Aphis craccivora TaxID=307492 RepID=A0A6G0VZD4_APHCR|nr:hypothetical protein FWK35_00031110 [Aphis craccivora]